MNFPAFFSYAFLGAFTPGPNNIIAMSNASGLGFRRSLRFCFGVFWGFLAVLAACAVFASLLYEHIPAVEKPMKWIGAAYMLFLAVGILRPASHKQKGKAYLRTDSILTGVLMQFVNVKGIFYSITAMSSFILPYTREPFAISLFVIALAVVGFAGTVCWAAFGSLLGRVFEKHGKLMNAAMAMLLALCAVSALL